jgi:hypothetical protein
MTFTQARYLARFPGHVIYRQGWPRFWRIYLFEANFWRGEDPYPLTLNDLDASDWLAFDLVDRKDVQPWKSHAECEAWFRDFAGLFRRADPPLPPLVPANPILRGDE